MADSRSQRAAAPSGLERVLGLFTRVEAGEGTTALLLTFNVFLLMTAYSAIKPVREGLILAMRSGAEYKSYMGAAIAATLLVAVPVYARVADRVAKNRLVVGVTLFFAANLVLFWLGSALEPVRSRLGLVFYLWVGIFNMMVVAQFWAFANDLYREEQGKRLFPLLGVGQTVGAATGSALAMLLLQVIGVYAMLLASAVVLSLTALLTQIVHRRELAVRAGATSEPARPASASGNEGHGAFALVLSSKYLRVIAAFSLVFTFVNSNGEYMVGKLVKEAAGAAVAAGTLGQDSVKEWVGAMYGRFYFITNVATVVLQAFVVSRLVRWGGLRVGFFVLPAIALMDAGAVSVLPVLSVLFVGKIAENSTDYSLNNTLRNILWLPTTQEMKYKAKQAIDTFFVRMGDVSSALLVLVLADRLGLSVRAFALVNLGLAVLWIGLARAIVREHARLARAVPTPITV